MSIEEIYSIFRCHPTITTDSRNCPEGSIFFALKGENFNGNAYASNALQQGSAFAVIDDKQYYDPADSRMILVNDVLTSLQQLARHHRRQLGTPIIGITGTNGKTTTKELIAAVLKKKYNILYTQGNFNNHIGVPKTLLQLNSDHELAVIEMGANHPGEIRDLVNIAEPDYGIITNVGKAHLLGFGSFEGVIRTKGELYDFMRCKSGTVFINNDNPHLNGIAQNLQLVRYGQNHAKANSIEGRLLSCAPFLKFEWKSTNGSSFRTVQTQLIGAYNIDNALAAITIGTHFGVCADDICSALEEYVPSNNRSQLKKTGKNTLVIDAYNANPTSMAAALDNFALMETPHKMCILGDMKELGEASQSEHIKALRKIIESEFEQVWLVGEEFKKALSALDTETTGITTFSDANEVIAQLKESEISGRTILIKGSNSTRLISLVEHL